MGKKIDLTGLIFGRWTVLQQAEKDKNGKLMWFCRCDCGTERIVDGNHLRRGATISCGCYKMEVLLKHGMARTSIYQKWGAIKQRCYNKDCENYKHYGARGITICDEWNEFKSFMEWALQNGYSDDLEIDRIDNNKGYSPDNCRFSTRSDNLNNRRNTVLIEIEGVTKPLMNWVREYELNENTFRERVRSGTKGTDLIRKVKK